MSLEIKSQTLAVKCEICHQNDVFDAERNYCERCTEIEKRLQTSLGNDAKQIPVEECYTKRVIEEKRFQSLYAILAELERDPGDNIAVQADSKYFYSINVVKYVPRKWLGIPVKTKKSTILQIERRSYIEKNILKVTVYNSDYFELAKQYIEQRVLPLLPKPDKVVYYKDF